MDRLQIHRDGTLLREVELQTATSIGRHRQCLVQLEDPRISRVHAIVTRETDGYVLEDQGGMNGTHVNGRKLAKGESVPITDGDVVRIDSFELKFDLEFDSRDLEQTLVHEASGPDLLQTLEQPPLPNVLLSHLLENRDQIPVWTEGEIQLVIADIIEETWDVKTFRLVGKSPTLFSYKPGQFLTLTVNIDGKPVKRSYSISASPSRPHTLEVTIKRVPGGLVSNWVADNLKLGDEVVVRGPAGKFSCFDYPSRKMLCLAGGSGITPIMSMCRWIVDTTADVDVVLLYSARSPKDIIFLKELEYISARHSGFRILITVTSDWCGTESWTGLTGRIDHRMFELAAPDFMERHIYLCGPKPFSDSIKGQLKELGYPIANLHTESFGSGRVAKGARAVPQDVPAEASSRSIPPAAPAPTPPAPAAAAPEQLATAPPAPAPKPEHVSTGFLVEFANSGVEVRTDGECCLLELAEVNGVDIDYGCREGSCGSCKTMCKSGRVTMEDNDLTDEERTQGWIYACVARPSSDIVVEA